MALYHFLFVDDGAEGCYIEGETGYINDARPWEEKDKAIANAKDTWDDTGEEEREFTTIWLVSVQLGPDVLSAAPTTIWSRLHGAGV